LKCKGVPAPVLATVLDVSFGGIGIVMSRKIKPGAIVEIPHSDFSCAPTRNTASTCRVIFMRPAKGSTAGTQYGLAFEATDTEFLLDLLEWVQMQTIMRKAHAQQLHNADPQADRPSNPAAQTKQGADALQGLITVCCSCRKVRTDKGKWQKLETYIRNGSGAEFTHSICPECKKKLYSGLSAKK